MNDRATISSPLEQAFRETIRDVVRDEIRALKDELKDHDRLLDAKAAAALLSVSPDWLYRKARRLPFTRKLGPKMLRFSYQGIQKYLATRKIA